MMLKRLAMALYTVAVLLVQRTFVLQYLVQFDGGRSGSERFPRIFSCHQCIPCSLVAEDGTGCDVSEEQA